MTPFWYVSKLVPRNKGKIIFGAWYGEKYSDNSRYLFEYFLLKGNIRCIWITNNKTVHDYLQGEGIEVYKKNSLKSIYHSLTAGYVFFSSGKIDVNYYFINGSKIINLYHGAPLKKIGMQNDKINSVVKNKIRKYLIPNSYEYNIDYVLSTSKCFDQIMQDSFGLQNQNVLKFGFPRNDHLVDYDHAGKTECKIKIAYVPTFRDGFPSYDLFHQFKYDHQRMHEVLLKYDAELHLATHFVSDNSHSNKIASDRIKLMDNKNELFDINKNLSQYSVLITDYSSIYFDFLLTKKPIILAPFDKEFYLKNCRKLFFNYDDLKNDGMAFNWVEVIQYLENILSEINSKDFTKKNIYNDYSGGSCKKLYDFVILNQ